MTPSIARSDKSKPWIPLAGQADDGWSRDGQATATCYCGILKLSFPTEGLGLIGSFICNCTNCHKITASMFASNFTVDNKYLTHIRGREEMTAYGQSKTINSGNKMTNYFCSKCGTLMYRVSSGFPDRSILRIGTIDDLNLLEDKLKLTVQQFVGSRVRWLGDGVPGLPQVKADHLDDPLEYV